MSDAIERARWLLANLPDGHADLVVAQAVIDLTTRRDELLVTVKNLSLSTPYPEEASSAATLIAEVGTLKAKVATAERERDEARAQLKFTHPVFNHASKGPVVVEPDGALPGDREGTYRIVRTEDIERYRNEYQTTARPPYLATVYSHDDALLVAFAFNEFENVLRAMRQASADRDAARVECERLRERSVVLSADATSDTVKAELAQLRADLAQRDKDWDALMVLIAQTVGTEAERDMADSDDMEEFDPWHALRRAQLTEFDQASLRWLLYLPLPVKNEQERQHSIAAMTVIARMIGEQP